MRKALQVLLVLIVLGAGAGVAALLIRARRKPPRRAFVVKPPLVTVVRAARRPYTVVIEAFGTVTPAQEITVYPQVSGLIVEQSPELVPGGLLKEGDLVARIDARDYELALAQQQGQVERALFGLRVEEGRRVVAEREWKLLGEEVDNSDAGRALALREPHLRNAKAALESARSSLKRAEIDLARTLIRAPFNAFVQEESVDRGQLAGPQTPLAKLVGTDRFWVRLSLPMDKLSFIRVPGVNGCRRGEGSRARIVQLTRQGPPIEREGRVIRLMGALEPNGRMARVLIEVADPLRLKTGAGLPLLLGAYVRAEIRGRRLNDVCCLPREVLREGNNIWIAEPVSDAGHAVLRIRKDVGIVCRERDLIVVDKGVNHGELVIAGSVSVPTDGKRVRTIEKPSQPTLRPTPAAEPAGTES